jgi:Ran GTPase-activating protein (RanGAP) involved in mRNA processing and transport
MFYRRRVRPGASFLLLVACARGPAAAPSLAPETIIKSVPEDSERSTPTAPADISDPIAALRARLPERRGWDGEPIEPDIRSMWHELGVLLDASEPGPARDELLRIGAATAATWPDDERVAPNGWNEAWVGGSAPFAWSLVRAVRILDMDQARTLLAGEALAQVTVLTLNLNHVAELCERPDEFFDSLAAARHLGELRSLTLALPTCVPPAALAGLDRARPGLGSLRRLVLPGWLGPQGAAALAESPLLAQLEELDLSNSEPGRAGLAALGRSQFLQRLKVVRLHRSLDSSDAGLALADTPAWTGLRELDLSANILTRATLAGLGRNPALKDLVTLDIGRSRGQGDARFSAFARAGGLPGLRRLRIDGVMLGDAELAAILGARRWSGLRELDLSTNKIGPAGAAALARATHLTDLKRLDLGHNPLGAQGGRALADAVHLAGLLGLDLTGCGIGEASATRLLARRRRRSRCRTAAIGDGGARAIAARREWTSLRTLELDDDAIGDDGAVALAGAAHLVGLQSLKLRGNRMRELGWRALVESRPLAKFVDAEWRRRLALHDTTLSPADAARPLPADLELVFRRGACHGSCPVYSVTIRGDALEYRGEQHVTVKGPVRERVDPTRIRLVLAAVDAFFAAAPGRRSEDGSEDCRTSLYGDAGPSIRVVRDGESFVHGRDGVCPTRDDFRAFQLLADRIDTLLDTGRWMPTW